ncbi:hypothetical protein [Streptomyces griseus]|uniref:hypothetical protein n=1 Tax=Streptomyces griseus TaxID=1911 RepID=UPI0013BAF6B0|nr:hypothetical protein [Streptomyces griseus]
MARSWTRLHEHPGAAPGPMDFNMVRFTDIPVAARRPTRIQSVTTTLPPPAATPPATRPPTRSSPTR